MSDQQQTATKPATSAAAASSPTKAEAKPPAPAAPPAKVAPPAKGAPSKPDAAPQTPEQRDRAEHTAALLKARKVGEDLATTRERLAALERESAESKRLLAEAQAGGSKAKETLVKLAKEDPDALFRELNITPNELGRALLAKRKGAPADPRDEVIEGLRKELGELSSWRKSTEEQAKKREEEQATASERAYGQALVDHATSTMRQSMEAWAAEAPSTPETRREAAGDELFLASLAEDPSGWAARLKAYEKEHPNHKMDDARKFYGAHLLRGYEARAKLSHVGALLGGRTTDAPTDETGGKSRADVPRTINRRLTAERASETTTPEGELSLKQRDEAEKASRRSLAAIASPKR